MGFPFWDWLLQCSSHIQSQNILCRTNDDFFEIPAMWILVEFMFKLGSKCTNHLLLLVYAFSHVCELILNHSSSILKLSHTSLTLTKECPKVLESFTTHVLERLLPYLVASLLRAHQYAPRIILGKHVRLKYVIS